MPAGRQPRYGSAETSVRRKNGCCSRSGTQVVTAKVIGGKAQRKRRLAEHAWGGKRKIAGEVIECGRATWITRRQRAAAHVTHGGRYRVFSAIHLDCADAACLDPELPRPLLSTRFGLRRAWLRVAAEFRPRRPRVIHVLNVGTLRLHARESIRDSASVASRTASASATFNMPRSTCGGSRRKKVVPAGTPDQASISVDGDRRSRCRAVIGPVPIGGGAAHRLRFRPSRQPVRIAARNKRRRPQQAGMEKP